MIHGFPSAFIDLIPQAAKRLLRAEPRLKLDLVVSPRSAAVTAVATGDADAAITFTAPSDPPEAPGLVRAHLLDDPMLVVLPTDHPLTSQRTIALRDLADSRWILSASAGPHALTHDALQER